MVRFQKLIKMYFSPCKGPTVYCQQRELAEFLRRSLQSFNACTSGHTSTLPHSNQTHSRLGVAMSAVMACSTCVIRLRNTVHTVIFGMANSLLALATDLQGLATPHALFQCCHQTHEVDQGFCLYTSIQSLQTVGTTWLYYSCVVRLF
jgi:hypothetical protein